MDEIRESIVSLGLGGASQVALGTGQEHSLNLLLLLNQLLVNEDARFSVLCRLTLRDLFLESATQLMKNWERLVQHVEEVEEDNNGALAYRLIQFFRLYARLAGDEPLPLAAVLFGKFGGTEVGRERLFIHVYSLLQSSCVSKLLSSLDATDTDRRDAAALKSLADTLHLMDHLDLFHILYYRFVGRLIQMSLYWDNFRWIHLLEPLHLYILLHRIQGVRELCLIGILYYRYDIDYYLFGWKYLDL